MHLTVHRVSAAEQVPDDLFWALDGEDTRFICAFDHYPDTLQYVVAAWAISGEDDLYTEPTAALIATFGHIITGYIDLRVKPNHKGRLTGMLKRLRKVSNATWLLVHDADDVECWLEQGFRVVEPPDEEAVLVLAWGDLPEDASALLRARGLSWNVYEHRGYTRREPGQLLPFPESQDDA
jgi:hypothetical protein